MVTVNHQRCNYLTRWVMIVAVFAGESITGTASSYGYSSLELQQTQQSPLQQQLQSVDTWTRPGCHKVGHTRLISIPNCVEFHISTNACRGYCESWTVPSPLDTVKTNPHQPITSIGECCNIMETEDVEISVLCLDGTKDLVFKSATSCSCYHCKKD